MSKNKKPTIDLASLYPRPKTYDEQQAERDRITAKKEARQPQHIGMLAAASLSIIFVYTLWIIVSIPGLVSGNPMAGVPFSLLLGIVWFGLVYLTAKDILKMFEMKGYRWGPFFVVYGACVSALVSVGNTIHFALVPLLLLTLLHFFVVCLIITVAYTKRLSNVLKIIILSTLWIAAFVVMVGLAIGVFR